MGNHVFFKQCNHNGAWEAASLPRALHGYEGMKPLCKKKVLLLRVY